MDGFNPTLHPLVPGCLGYRHNGGDGLRLGVLVADDLAKPAYPTLSIDLYRYFQCRVDVEV